jgi:hypothetical protein
MRKNNQSARRRLFTLAHELGHVILPWHIGLAACTPVKSPIDAEPIDPTYTGGLLTRAGIEEQEAEATRFAGSILAPRRFIEAYAEEGIGELLAALNSARMSAIATMLTLSRNLLPGFCFLIDEDEEGFWTVQSSGTQLPSGRGGKSREAQLRDHARDFGEVQLSGRRVLWFQLASQADFFLSEDDRTTTQILRDSLASTVSPIDRVGMQTRINGIVGGMLSKGERAQAETQALSVLEHRFESDEDFRLLFDNPDFRLYLRRKAAERVRSINHVDRR